MTNPKVFEFAKEIGMETLSLMDKIRDWKLPVKNHMAELTPELIEEIQTKLKSEKSGDGGKKVSVRKKAPAKKKTEASAGKSAKASKTTKTAKATKTTKTTKVTKVTKTTKAASKDEKTTKSTRAAKSADTSSKIIRRKAKDDEKPEETTAPETEVELEAAPTTIEEAVEQPATVVEPEVVQAEAPTEIAAKSEEPLVPEEVKKESRMVRKKEVVVGASGTASSTQPALVPKNNIVGRMDLSRVSGPPGAQGQGQQRPGGFSARPGGPLKTSNRNIRPGFVADAVPMQPFEDVESRRGRFEEKSKKKQPGESGAAAPKEGEQAHFDAAEFRKREMVFQPKKKKGRLNRESLKTQITTPKASKRVIKVNQTMKVGDLANEMGIKATQLVKSLMQNGVMGTINTDLDFDTIALIVPDFGFEAQNVYKTAEEVIQVVAFGDLDAESIPRAPVVTVMGHVDHGKTSLLDAIRKADVVSGEAGGITQHIGAYSVQVEGGHTITFIDTPGHEAFTAMRARGANVTDIAIVVVAADDGVMPQTIEAISHAKAANVPIIVAVNKIDKQGANVERIKQQLTEYEVIPEEWGGTNIFCEVSAIQKTGIKELLEQIHLQAEMLELKANPNRSATGIVIESRLDKGRGPVATILVQDGTIKIGQAIVAGVVTGRVRNLINDRGERVTEAGPGMPVEILGLKEPPSAGDRFDIVKDDESADNVAQIYREQKEAMQATPHSKMSLEDLFSKVNKGDVKELAVVIKADVAGSLEAIQGMLSKQSTAEVKIKVIHAAVGGITASDVLLSGTAKGIVIGFNVRPDSGAQSEAKRLGVEIRTYSIVYELVEDIKKAMVGLLSPDVIEKVMGRAEVRNTFSVPKLGTIAGCAVVDGKIARSNLARLIRDGRIVYEGKIASLKRFKDDAKEVQSGFECGIGIENFNDIKVGDVIEAFVKEEVARELSSPLAPPAN